MSLFQAVLISLLQGLTEFLPISSSGHLKLLETFFDLKGDFLFFDLVCHGGTLFSILLILRKEIWKVFQDKEMFWMLVIAILPLFPLVFAIKSIKNIYATPHILGYFFLVTSLLLFCGEYFSRKRSISNKLTALLIGIAQGVALLPGISRSGMTIAMARFLGWERVKAAKFSFLLAIPTILGGLALEGGKIILEKDPGKNLPFFIYIVGFVISFTVGSFMLRGVLILFKKVSLKPFAVYCAIVGIITLILT